jgi:hypothetical protein
MHAGRARLHRRQVYRGHIYIKHYREGFETRNPAIMMLISQAVKSSLQRLPDIDAVVATWDYSGAEGQQPVWAFCEPMDGRQRAPKFLVPGAWTPSRLASLCVLRQADYLLTSSIFGDWLGNHRCCAHPHARRPQTSLSGSGQRPSSSPGPFCVRRCGSAASTRASPKRYTKSSGGARPTSTPPGRCVRPPLRPGPACCAVWLRASYCHTGSQTYTDCGLLRTCCGPPRPETSARCTQALLRVLKDKPYADVAGVSFHDLRSKDPAAMRLWKDTEELCDFQYQVYTEGNSWSGGRQSQTWRRITCLSAAAAAARNR